MEVKQMSKIIRQARPSEIFHKGITDEMLQFVVNSREINPNIVSLQATDSYDYNDNIGYGYDYRASFEFVLYQGIILQFPQLNNTELINEMSKSIARRFNQALYGISKTSFMIYCLLYTMKVVLMVQER
jgi:hypothetical protein